MTDTFNAGTRSRAGSGLLPGAIALAMLVAGCQSPAAQSGPAPVDDQSSGSQGQSSGSTVIAQGTEGTSSASGRAQAVDGLLQVQQLQEELADLRNQVEVQQNEIERLKQRQRDFYDDLDRRVRATERAAGISTAGSASTPGGDGGTGASAGTESAGSGAGGQQRPATATVEQWQSRSGQQGQQSGSTQTASAANPAAIQDAYDQAFDLLKQSRYAEAIEAFDGFLGKYPASDLADDAQYWIAEAQYVTRDFDAAQSGFRTVVDRFPESSRVPDALLKIGYIQYETGNVAAARDTLQEVIDRFPGSRVAVSAETRLNRIEQEGQ